MRVRERLGLAQLAYLRAVAWARAEPTPASWRRLMTAANNLRGAQRDRQRELGGRSPGEGRRAPPFRPEPRGGAVIDLRPRPRPSIPARWSELAEDCEKARALMQRSRALVQQSRRLRLEIAELMARWRAAARGPV